MMRPTRRPDGTGPPAKTGCQVGQQDGNKIGDEMSKGYAHPTMGCNKQRREPGSRGHAMTS